MRPLAFLLFVLLAPLARAESPYDVYPGPDAAILAVTVGTSLGLAVAAKDLIHPHCPCDPKSVNAFDRVAIGNHSNTWSTVSDVSIGLTPVIPIVADLLADGFSMSFVKDLVVLGETVAVNGAFVQIVKVAVQRPLPRTYAGDPSLIHSVDGYRAFYSGHTSNAFAIMGYFTSTMQARGVTSWWPWALELAVGTSIAVERVVAGQHFPTDVIVGAVVGGTIGYVVPYLHRRTQTALSMWRDEEGTYHLSLSTTF